MCLLPLSVLAGGGETTGDWSLVEAHAQANPPEPIAWVIGQQENQRLGRFCMASLMETVSKEQAESGQKFEVRIGLWLNAEALEVRLPVRPSEPLFNRVSSIVGDSLSLVGPDDSTIDTFGAVVEEQPQTQPPNKLLSIFPVKFICGEREKWAYSSGCEVEIPRDDLLINLSRADDLKVFFWTKDDRMAEQSISIPESTKVINSLNKCVAALSKDQTYKDVVKLQNQDGAGN